MTSCIILKVFILLREALLSNHHSLQSIHSYQFHFLHILQALITHFKQAQIEYEGQIESAPFWSITTLVTYGQFFNAAVKSLILFNQYNCFLYHVIIIHPFSFRYYFSSSVVLNASSPSLSFKPLSLILNHANVRVVPSTIAHIHFANSESIIHYSVLTVIRDAPTIGFIVQHVTFPSLSIITQIQHLIVFNSINLLSIHSQ